MRYRGPDEAVWLHTAPRVPTETGAGNGTRGDDGPRSLGVVGPHTIATLCTKLNNLDDIHGDVRLTSEQYAATSIGADERQLVRVSET
jgi:hypothetical protein